MKWQGRNRLSNETSPYLLQHADNPVDWYPWGDEALARARDEDKPILLSIGYSACHWCHVMAHESFESRDIAQLMNKLYVNIKVDREERPDLDTVYMEAVQTIAGRGGWPLTVFLTPDGKPYFGGTYFPPEDRHGMPGFPRVLQAMSDAYRDRRGDVEQAARRVMAALEPRTARPGAAPLTTGLLDSACTSLNRVFDRADGGFGQAPKFPQPMVLELLLRQYRRTGDRDALQMVTQTLDRMARGGIYDQLSGGFHRYATDSQWLVPHFEKMLYDNALLPRIYLYAYLVTGDAAFRRIAGETIDWMLREMSSPEGGFYSTLDADTEGEEGRFYVWTPQEIRAAIGDRQSAVLEDYYGVTARGNFEGRNILNITGALAAEEPAAVREAKAALLEKRETRIRPGRDEKVLASWNGLMLSTLAEAAVILDREDLLEAAAACGSFLLSRMMHAGHLRHAYSHGEARIEGYLEDYALVAGGLLELHQATLGGRWLREAIRLAGAIVEHFWDEPAGMFYDTGEHHENLFMRPSSTLDTALPSGASAAAMVLLKIGRLTQNAGLHEVAARSLQGMHETMTKYPMGAGNWLCTLDFYLSTPREVVIAGPAGSRDTMEMLQALSSTWVPNKVVCGVDTQDPAAVTDLPLTSNKGMIDDRPTAYLCENYSCRAPATSPETLREQVAQLPQFRD